MSGAPILIIFSLMFTVASLLAPLPMFPGNLVCVLIGPAMTGYSEYLSAAANGIFYGVITWLVFLVISKRLEQEK